MKVLETLVEPFTKDSSMNRAGYGLFSSLCAKAEAQLVCEAKHVVAHCRLGNDRHFVFDLENNGFAVAEVALSEIKTAGDQSSKNVDFVLNEHDNFSFVRYDPVQRVIVGSVPRARVEKSPKISLEVAWEVFIELISSLREPLLKI